MLVCLKLAHQHAYAPHLDLTLIELLTLSLAVLNGWWHKPHKPLDVPSSYISPSPGRT